MVPCFDRVVTNLCTDTARNAIEWDDNAGSTDGGCKLDDKGRRRPTLLLIAVEDDEFIDLLMKKEDTLMKEINGYANNYQGAATEMRWRAQAINWILNVHAYFGFRKQTAFLSVTYFDRFVSKHTDSRGKRWLLQLIAVGSISLAAKLQEIEVPHLNDVLQVGAIEHVFASRTIQRMELLIMSTLNWNMSYVTPFSYLRYLLSKIGFNDGMSEALIVQSEELILHSCRDFRYLSYSPSAVAVASLVWACREEIPSQATRLQQALHSIWPLKEIEAMEWAHLMDQLMRQETLCEFASVEREVQKSVVPLSPMGVLDAACFSSDSCDQTLNTFSATTCASLRANVSASTMIMKSVGVGHQIGSSKSNEPSSTSALPPQAPRKRKSLGGKHLSSVQNKHFRRSLSRI